jgi:hypothetical protein
MRDSILLPAFAAIVATTFVTSVTPAEARRHAKQQAREWRGADGRMHYCRNDGMIGGVVGGVAGALVGRSIDTRGDRTFGTVVVAGALTGLELVRKRGCR